MAARDAENQQSDVPLATALSDHHATKHKQPTFTKRLVSDIQEREAGSDC